MDIEFTECPTCAAKSGLPTLCNSCLKNRNIIENLTLKLNPRKSDDKLKTLIISARKLAVEADCYACGEGDRDDLEEAINEVEILTCMRKFNKKTGGNHD
jgi:hypothetical protein